MALEEKRCLFSGKDFWQTRSVERLGVVLGPGLNVKRSPFRGRNFEDPFLTGKMAASYIQAEILWMVRTGNDDAVQRFFQEPGIMCACTREDNGQRKPLFID